MFATKNSPIKDKKFKVNNITVNLFVAKFHMFVHCSITSMLDANYNFIVNMLFVTTKVFTDIKNTKGDQERER